MRSKLVSTLGTVLIIAALTFVMTFWIVPAFQTELKYQVQIVTSPCGLGHEDIEPTSVTIHVLEMRYEPQNKDVAVMSEVYARSISLKDGEMFAKTLDREMRAVKARYQVTSVQFAYSTPVSKDIMSVFNMTMNQHNIIIEHYRLRKQLDAP